MNEYTPTIIFVRAHHRRRLTTTIDNLSCVCLLMYTFPYSRAYAHTGMCIRSKRQHHRRRPLSCSSGRYQKLSSLDVDRVRGRRQSTRNSSVLCALRDRRLKLWRRRKRQHSSTSSIRKVDASPPRSFRPARSKKMRAARKTASRESQHRMAKQSDDDDASVVVSLSCCFGYIYVCLCV